MRGLGTENAELSLPISAVGHPSSSLSLNETKGVRVAEIDLAWRSSGACQGLDPEIFYPDNEDNCSQAKSVCSECKVRIACLSYALDSREKQGVWGGASARERRKMLRTRRSA